MDTKYGSAVIDLAGEIVKEESTITSNGLTLKITTIMPAHDQITQPAGAVYIELVDPATGEIIWPDNTDILDNGIAYIGMDASSPK